MASKSPETSSVEDIETAYLTAGHHTPSLQARTIRKRHIGTLDHGFLTNWWFWELLAAIFSVLCLAAIIGLLIRFDDEKVPQFLDGITLNALISVLAAASKSSLLAAVAAAIGQLKWKWFKNDKTTLSDLQVFDEATRGPWGALMSLPLLRWKSLASVGAIVTILSIGIDPFAQQLITFPNRIVFRQDASAATKQAFTYASNPANVSTEGGMRSLTKIQAHDLERAILQGIYDGDTTLRPLCPSGDCDFPPVHSLAWCSACEDVTAGTVLDGCKVDIDFTKINDTSGTSIPCTASLPNGKEIDVDIAIVPSSDTAVDSWAVYSPTVTFTSAFDFDEDNNLIWHPGMSYAGIIDPAAAFAFIEFENSNNVTSHAPPVKMKSATVCTLSPCVNKYHFSVRVGTPNNKILETTYGDVVRYLGIDQVEWNTTIPASNSTEGQDLFFYLKQTAVTAPASMLTALMDFQLRKLWYVNTTTDNTTGDYTINVSTLTNDIASQGMILQFVAGGVGIQETFKNLADALTVLVYDASNDTVTGQLGTSETFVHVSWVWMIAPSTIVIIGALFLLLTVFETQRRKERIWKSSQLALLWRSKEENWNSAIGNSGVEFGSGDWKLSKMESEAKKITAGMLKAGKRKPVTSMQQVSNYSSWDRGTGDEAERSLIQPSLDVVSNGSRMT